MSQRRMDRASVFATVAVGAAVLAMIVMVAVALGAFSSDGADASSPEDEQIADDGAVAARLDVGREQLAGERRVVGNRDPDHVVRPVDRDALTSRSMFWTSASSWKGLTM